MNLENLQKQNDKLTKINYFLIGVAVGIWLGIGLVWLVMEAL